MNFASFASRTVPLKHKTMVSAKPFDMTKDLKPGMKIRYLQTWDQRWAQGIFVRYGCTPLVNSWEQPHHVFAYWGGASTEFYMPAEDVRLVGDTGFEPVTPRV
jgi:hypothetical protein